MRCRRSLRINSSKDWCNAPPKDLVRRFGYCPFRKFHPAGITASSSDGPQPSRRKAVVDAEIAAFRPSAPFQSVPKPRKPRLIFWIVLREGSQHADASWLIGLLRARRDRPRSRSAAEQSDELAPANHSITSSARASSLSGTIRPSAFAVLRLITSSSL